MKTALCDDTRATSSHSLPIAGSLLLQNQGEQPRRASRGGDSAGGCPRPLWPGPLPDGRAARPQFQQPADAHGAPLALQPCGLLCADTLASHARVTTAPRGLRVREGSDEMCGNQ